MENPLYHSEPFNRTHAWVDLILLANHKENYFYKRGIRVDVGIGQIGYDVESLGNRWQWSRGKVERFLKDLEKDGMIVRQKTNVTTLISISKYNEYQANDNPNDKPNGHQTIKQTIKQTDTNKNDKNEKNEENEKTDIPAREDFVEYGLSLVGNNKGYEFTLNAKFDSWVENKWRDGKGQKIKNWKTKLANTIPYLKPMAQPNELNVDHSHPLMQKLKGVDYTNQKL